MMKSTIRRVAVATLLSATLFVASCSSDDPDSESSGSATPTASDTASADPTATPTDTPSATPTVPATPLTSLDQISVENVPLGTLPTIEADWPLVTDTTISKTLIEGTGPEVNAGLQFAFYYIGVNARTGEQFDTNFLTTPFQMSATGSLIEGFTKSVTGVKAGSRVLIAITSADGYATGNANAGIEIGDTIIFVVDIVSAAFTEPTGDVLLDGDAYSTVTVADGVPTIHPIAGAGAPEKTVVSLLVAGVGPYQAAADGVVSVRYTGIVAETGRVLESNYDAENPELAILNRLIPGFADGVTSQFIGSRLLLTIPAAEAYPNGSDAFDPPLAAGQTLIYVVDLLWTMPLQ
jgi:peptidylprolyl isomerase